MIRRFIVVVAAAITFVSSANAADNVVEIDGMKSKAPASWKEQKPVSQQRVAQFKIDRAAGDTEDAELVIFYFGKDGGGTLDANIARWKGQFKNPAADKIKTEKFKVGDVPATSIDITGTYLFKKSPRDEKSVEKPDFRVINVFFASPNGPYYFKLVGPAKTVDGQKKAFDNWVKGFK